MSAAGVLVHLIGAVLYVGAATHQALFAWRAAQGRGAWSRAARFAALTSVIGLVTLALGLWLYPTYIREVRVPVLNLKAPGVARWFDVKEHLVALALPLHLGAWALVIGRRGPMGASSALLYRVATTGGALLGWIGAIIGAWVVIRQGHLL